MIPQCCTAHKNHVIRRKSANAFPEHSIVFQSMGEVNRYNCLLFLKEHGHLYVCGQIYFQQLNRYLYKYDIHSNNIFREKRKKPNKNFNLGKSDLNQHHNQKRETPLIRWWIHVWHSSLYIFLYDNIDVNTWITRDLWEKPLDKFRIMEFSALRFANFL